MANGLSFDDAILLTTDSVGNAQVSPGSLYIYFKFDVIAGERYVFYVKSSDDTYGYLYDENRNQIAYNDDGGEGSNPRIQFTASKTTVMYAMVRAYHASSTIDFQALLDHIPPVTMIDGISFDIPKLLLVNGSATSKVSPDYPNIYFKFDVIAGEKYVFYVESDDDTYGYLYDENRNEIDSDDDSGQGYNPLIQFTASKTTSMYAMVRAYSESDTIDFKAILQPSIPVDGDSFQRAIPIELLENKSLTFTNTLTTIYLKADLTEGTMYTFTIPNVLDAYVYDENERNAQYDFIRGDDFISLDFTAITSTMYIEVIDWNISEETFNVLLDYMDLTIIKDIDITTNLTTVKIGKTLQLEIEISPQGATGDGFIWTSSNENIATVSSNGLVTARGLGQAMIQVSTASGIYDRVPVDVVQWDGYGSRNSPFLVSSADDLNAVRTYNYSFYKQVADIDLSEYENWIPIGDVSRPFYGIYDGNGYKITNLRKVMTAADYNPNSSACIGLFGVGNRAEFTNVTIENAHMETYTGYCGMLVGFLYDNSVIDNCIVRNSTINNRAAYVGGLIGMTEIGPLITHCHVINCNINVTRQVPSIGVNSVSFGTYTGGLIGFLYRTDTGRNVTHRPLNSCSATNITFKILGEARFDDFILGGLVGFKNDTWTIQNCFATVNFESDFSEYSGLGGLVGFGGSTINRILDCYAIASFSPMRSRNKGGLIGRVSMNIEAGVNVINSYYDSNVSGLNVDNFGGQPRTTEQMKRKATFVDWDFDNVWDIIEGVKYPTVRPKILLTTTMLQSISLNSLRMVPFRPPQLNEL